jgi:hypothetical protein
VQMLSMTDLVRTRTVQIRVIRSINRKHSLKKQIRDIVGPLLCKGAFGRAPAVAVLVKRILWWRCGAESVLEKRLRKASLDCVT